MNRTKSVCAVVTAGILASLGAIDSQAAAQTPAAQTAPSFSPTVEDWVGVNAAVNNYTLGLELKDMSRYDRAFWPEATIVVQPEPGRSITMPYQAAAAPPPAPPGGGPMTNAAGGTNPPWHLALSHHFEFQSPTRATHYGYFVSVYPDLETKLSSVGLPGHYEDILEKRDGEWRILQRTTAIGVK